jgi:hypothetical protein
VTPVQGSRGAGGRRDGRPADAFRTQPESVLSEHTVRSIEDTEV